MEHSSDLYNTYLKDLEALKSGAIKTSLLSGLIITNPSPTDITSILSQRFSKPMTTDVTLTDITILHMLAKHAQDWAADVLKMLREVLEKAKTLPGFKEILEIQTASRRTPLMYAIISGNFEATKIFIEYGANYKLMTESGSPIIMAIESNSVTMLDYLLTLKDCPSLTATDLAGLTPMYVACYNSKSDIVKYLLDRPEWVSLLKSRGPFNATIFHALADQDFTELAELIITTIKERENAISLLGEIVTTQDESEYGDTALHLAAKEGYTGFLYVCLEVLPNKKEIVEKCLNEAGETMIQVAEEENHEEAILYLQSLLGIQPANGIGYYCVTF